MSEQTEQRGDNFIPLWQQRNAQLREEIKTNAQPTEADKQQIAELGYVRKTGYVFTGDSPTIPIAEGVTTPDITNNFGGQDKQFLEIGPGTGINAKTACEKNQRIDYYHTLDIIQMVKPQNLEEFQKAGLDYRIGNIEFLNETFHPNSMDFIKCDLVLMHTVDPLAAIQQMYEVLRPNGVISIKDKLPLQGIKDHLGDMLVSLNKQGYQFAAEYSYQLIDNQLVPADILSLTIKKTPSHKHLELPVEYAHDDQGQIIIDTISSTQKKVRYEYKGSNNLWNKVLPPAIRNILTKENIARNPRITKEWLIGPLSRIIHPDAVDRVIQEVNEDMSHNLSLNPDNINSYLKNLRLLIEEKARGEDNYQHKAAELIKPILKEKRPGLLKRIKRAFS